MNEKIYLRGHSEGKRVVATDFTEDRDGERIDVKGLDIKNFKKNPVLMFGHNHQILPVGKATKIKVEGDKLTFEPEFSAATQHARDVSALWEEGVLNAVSVGFIPQERDGNVFTKSELLEISVVNVPANPNALAQAKSKGLNVDLLDKEVPASRNLDSFPETKAWDGAAAIKRLKKWADGNFDKYKQAFLWRDEKDAENFSSYKLPIADVDGENIKVVWRAVATAQAVILGAQGGVDIPESDKRKAHSLLAVYYKKFDKKQPEFRSYSEEEVHKLVSEKSLLPEDAYDLLAALHRSNTGESKDNGADGSAKEISDDEIIARAIDAIHPALQEINKTSNITLKLLKDVRRKRQERS